MLVQRSHRVAAFCPLSACVCPHSSTVTSMRSPALHRTVLAQSFLVGWGSLSRAAKESESALSADKRRFDHFIGTSHWLSDPIPET